MTEQEAHNILSNRFKSLKQDRASVVFLRKSDNSFLGTDIAVSGFLSNPQLYYTEDNPRLNEIIVGLYKNNYSVINNSTNAIVSIG